MKTSAVSGAPEEIHPGPVIRSLRRSADITLSQLSAKTGLAASTLSKLEAGLGSPSFDKLAAISRALGVDMAELLGSPPQPVSHAPGRGGRRVVVRAGEGKHVETHCYSQLYVATELLHKMMTPIIVEVRARTMDEFRAEFGDFIRHPGEEFAFVIDGEVDFCTDLYEPLRLRQGDTLYFDSEMGHAYLKASDGPCRLVAASAAPGSSEHMIEKFVSASKRRAGTNAHESNPVTAAPAKPVRPPRGKSRASSR